MQYELTTLSNNIKLLHIHSPGSKSCTVQAWFSAGSALEDHSEEGIAHFLEHMFFKGTKKRPGAMIAHDVESYGGEINAFTSFDYTCYYINAPFNRMLDSTEILMDMVSNPIFKEEDIPAEREVVFEEYLRAIDSPNQFSFMKLQEGMFEDKYSHPILGREDTIKNFSKEQLESFRDKYYSSENFLLVVAGDLKNDRKKLISLIEGFKLPKGVPSDFPTFKLKPKTVIQSFEKETAMTSLTICIDAASYQDDRAVSEDLALNCFGHGESSVLYKSLVSDSSIASATTTSTMFMKDGGMHLIKVIYPIENHKKVLQKLKSIIQEVHKNGISRDEINKIKNQYIASKIYDLESLESFAFSLGHSYVQTNNFKADDEFIDKVKKCHTKSINQSISKIFERNIHISIQVPEGEDSKKYESTLKTYAKSLIPKSSYRKTAKGAHKVKKSKFDEPTNVIELKNGVKLIYRHNDLNPTFILHAYLKGGLSAETEKNQGSHHLISGVINKGYKGVGQEKLKRDLENKSASLSTFSGKNALGLTMHGQSEHSTELIQHFFGSLLNPSFATKNIAHEKTMALRALENFKTDPVKICFQELSKRFFKDHPYSFNILGTEKSIKSLNKKNLETQYDKIIKSSDIVFTFCGDLELEVLLEQIGPYIKSISPRKAKKKAVTKKIKSDFKDLHIPFSREQSHIFIGFPCGKLGAKENLHLRIMTSHLSGQSSELFVDVRDKKGLCYSAQPIHFVAVEAGYWGIYIATSNEKTDQAIEALEEIIQKKIEHGLDREEFERIKVMNEGQNLINIQTNDDYANIYSIPVLHGLSIDFFYNNNQILNDLTYEDFQQNIKKILKRKKVKIVVGNNN